MSNPNVQYNGGGVIANVKVVPIVWGDGLFPYTRPWYMQGFDAKLLAFIEFFVGPNSPNMTMLQEYGVSNPGSVLNVTIAPGAPPTSLLDAAPQNSADVSIQNTLESWILNNNNIWPNFPQPDRDTLYVIFLPAGVTVNVQGQNMCAQFGGGYHNGFSGYPVIYAVIGMCGVVPPSPFSPGTPLDQVFNQLTVTLSHELSEAITDPTAGGWLDANTPPPLPRDEIGDICRGVGYPLLNSPNGFVPVGAGQTFQVQPIWSNVQNNCVFGPPVKLSGITLTTVVYGGQPVAGSVSLSGLVPTLPLTGVTVSLSSTNYPGTIKFIPASVTILPGAGSISISGITSRIPETVVVTVQAELGTQTVQTDVTVLAAGLISFGYTPGSAEGYQYPPPPPNPNAPEGTMLLNNAAPAEGLTVGITSSEPLLVVPVPGEIPIPAGQLSPSEKFYLQVNPVEVDTPVTLTASVSGSALSFSFMVLAGGPPNIIVKSLTINPSTVIGGTSTFGEFMLAAAVGPGGGTISISSSDDTVATVPSTVTLTSGATSGSFPIHTKPLHQPIHIKYCTITAGESGRLAYALLTVTS